MDLADANRLIAASHHVLEEAYQAAVEEHFPEEPRSITLHSDFGLEISKHFRSFRPEERKAIFDIIEWCVHEGCDDTKTAVCTGLLEMLLSESSGNRLDFLPIAVLLGEESAQYCRAWDQFTGCRTPGLWG